MAPEKMVIGVIGAGRWGPNLIRNFETLAGSKVVKVSDLDEGRLKLVGERHSEIAATTDCEDIFTDSQIKAVVICTPAATHFELAKRALDSGKHVFVEKPLATTVDHCEQLGVLAQKSGLVLFVGHVFVYNAGIQAAREIIRSKDFGKIYYIQVNRTNFGPIRTDVNCLWDLAPHDISILRYWFDKNPEKVSAVGGKYLNKGIDDTVFSTYTYSDGIVANIHVSWLSPKKIREIVVIGEKKMLIWDDIDLSKPLTIYNKSASLETSALVDTFDGFRATILEGDTIIPSVRLNEPLFAECEAFLNAIIDPSSCISGPVEGRQVVEALVATEKSINMGGEEVKI